MTMNPTSEHLHTCFFFAMFLMLLFADYECALFALSVEGDAKENRKKKKKKWPRLPSPQDFMRAFLLASRSTDGAKEGVLVVTEVYTICVDSALYKDLNTVRL